MTDDAHKNPGGSPADKPGLPLAPPCRAVDKAQFMENLYQSCWNDLCGWLRRRYGPGPPEPEEIAQTAFAKVAAVEDPARIHNPRAFLFTTAVNSALMSINWLNRTRRFIDSEMQHVGQNLEEITPDRVYSSEEQFNWVSRAYNRLSEKQREILVRSRLNGETYDQISADTGWSKADISRQLTAALAAVRKAMEAYERGESNE